MNNPDQPGLPVPLEIQTRFLIPFQIKSERNQQTGGAKANINLVDELTERLLQARFDQPEAVEDKKKSSSTNIWGLGSTQDTAGEIKELYRQEMLDAPLHFLFGGVRTRGCRHLQMNAPVLNKIFHNGLEWLPPHKSAPAVPPRLVTCPSGIELWLQADGLGVLSISLGLKGGAAHPLTTTEICSFNYSLSQRLHRPPASLRQPPSTNPAPASSLLPLEENAWHTGVKPANSPKLQAFMAERLGKRGGEFTLEQLRAWLLAPLINDQDLIEVAHSQFSVYTTATFGQEISFAGLNSNYALASLLSALAQLEEPRHAGAPSGEITVPHAVLNTKHWAAAGSQGAAHLLAHQGIPFDTQRILVVREKYFLVWLLAWMQDLVLQSFTQRSANLVRSLDTAHTSETVLQELDNLRREIMEFDAICFLNRVSARASINRWYRLGQQGFDVAATFEDVKRGVLELDALAKLHVQQDTWNDLRRIAAASGENVRAIKVMQSKVEWVEIFLVAVYSVYLVHYLGEDFGFPHTYMGFSIVLGSLVSAGLAAVKLKPWEHDQDAHPAQRNIVESLVATRTRFLSIIFLLIAGYIGLGFALRDQPEPPAKPPSSNLESAKPH